MIQHIVLSGGAYRGLYEIGCLNYLYNQSFYQFKNIKSVHGTSIGGFLGSIICLNMDWNELTNYFIQRPWHKITTISPSMFLDVIHKKGLLDTAVLDKAMIPLLNSCDIDKDVTLIDFYNKTGIELYLYTIPINLYECISLSYKTHPQLPLLKAIQMTCAMPYIFQPVEYNDEYYIDGGLLNNYPIRNCIERDDANSKNILSLRFQSNNTLTFKKDSNILEYGYFLYRQSQLKNTLNYDDYIKVENEVVIPCIQTNLDDAYNTLINENERKRYITEGEECAKAFLSYKRSIPPEIIDISNNI